MAVFTLKSDKQGFLQGHPLDISDLHSDLVNIHSELIDIKNILSKHENVRIAPSSISKILAGLNAHNKINLVAANEPITPQQSTEKKTDRLIQSSELSSIIAKARKSKNLSLNTVVQPKDKLGIGNSSFTSSNKDVVNAHKNHATNASIPAQGSLRDAKGRFISKNNKDNSDKSGLTNASIPAQGSLRDGKGRFISKNNIDDDDKLNTLSAGLKNTGSRIVDALGSLTSGHDSSDPDLQALGEVKSIIEPVGRGFGMLFGNGSNGLSRGQDRWYRRFFKYFTDRSRIDDLSNKREQNLLTKLGKKSKETSKFDFLGILPFLMTILTFLGGIFLKSFSVLGSPLRLLSILLLPLLKFLQFIAKKTGIDSIFEKSGSKRNEKEKTTTNERLEKGKDGVAKKPNSGIPKTTEDIKREKSAGKAISKGVLKKFPWIGSLISAGFLAKDISDITDSSDSKEEKTKAIGGSVGSTVGGLGGMVAGASVGATIGSVVPVVGTVVGGAVGGIVGGLGGDYLGEVLGKKFGEWVNTLRSSDLVSKLDKSWIFSLNVMSVLWKDLTGVLGSKWSTLSNYTQDMWADVGKGWDKVAGIAEGIWTPIQNVFDDVASSISDSFDKISDSVTNVFNDLSKPVIDTWTELYSKVKGVVKNSSWFGTDDKTDSSSGTTLPLGPLGLWGMANTAKNYVGSVFNRASKKTDLQDTVNSGTTLPLGPLGVLGVANTAKNYVGSVFNRASKKTELQEQDENQTAVLQALLNAGFTKSQAVALTAEVGREGNYNTSSLFGYHQDQKNSKTNMGMMSWQGDRGEKLYAYLQERGLIQNGQIENSQASLDAQGAFMMNEIQTVPAYNKTKVMFANNPDADPENYAKTLGTNYVGWASHNEVLKDGTRINSAAHDKRRQGYTESAERKVDGMSGILTHFGPLSSLSKNNEVTTQGQNGTADPNSIDNLMNMFNQSDTTSLIKQAIIEMIKTKSIENMPTAVSPNATSTMIANVKVSQASSIAQEPQVNIPVVSSSKDSNSNLDDVSRDINDRRIAHIVTGGYSGSS